MPSTLLSEAHKNCAPCAPATLTAWTIQINELALATRHTVVTEKKNRKYWFMLQWLTLSVLVLFTMAFSVQQTYNRNSLWNENNCSFSNRGIYQLLKLAKVISSHDILSKPASLSQGYGEGGLEWFTSIGAHCTPAIKRLLLCCDDLPNMLLRPLFP